MPAYELYLDELRSHYFGKESEKLHLRVLMNIKRQVVQIHKI
jgi:hypothetical protein